MYLIKRGLDKIYLAYLNMAYKALLLVCVSLGSLSVCHGYKAGPPPGSCTEMFPTGHDATAQTTAAPYTLTINTTSYKSGDTVELTLTATSPTDLFFEGFFVQARRADCSKKGVAIGSFSLESTDAEMKVMKCSGATGPTNAVAHTSSAHKTEKKFLWTNTATEDVFFQATIVNHKETFWTNFMTATLYDSTKSTKPTYKPCTDGASAAVLSVWIMLGLIILQVL